MSAGGVSCDKLRSIHAEALDCQRRILFIKKVISLSSDDMHRFCCRRISAIKDDDTRRILMSDIASDCADPFTYLSSKRDLIHSFSADSYGDLVAFEEAWNNNLMSCDPNRAKRPCVVSDVLVARLDAWNAGINDTIRAIEREMDTGDESSYSAYSSESETDDDDEEDDDEEDDDEEDDDDEDEDEEDEDEEDEEDESEETDTRGP
jgi:hypothetical protein